MNVQRPNIAVVGATGAVGREMLAILEQRRFAHGSIRLFASPRSAGQSITYRGEPIKLEPLAEGWHRGIDLALLSAGSGPSKQFAPAAVAAGVKIVDNSSAFRADPACHLIVPEVNGHTLPRGSGGGAVARGVLCAVPNCSAIIMLVALNPLRKAFGVSRVSVATYQAASGAGAAAMDELREQSRESLGGTPVEGLTRKVFAEPYAFNLFSHNAAIDDATGYNGEELKMISETRRIWDDPAVLVSPTCVRVPTMRAHAEAITVTLKRAATEREVRAALALGESVRLVDDRAGNRFPTPLKASGGDEVLVGRIRPDLARVQELHGPEATPGAETACDQWSLFVAGDQLRTGAALTAVKIAELLVG
jgi:aspartate-semialdehyde dehydrogenase